MTRADSTALGPYRMLNLSGEPGFMCGKVLGDLGADVIKVEPPGGDPAHALGRFNHDAPLWLCGDPDRATLRIALPGPACKPRKRQGHEDHARYMQDSRRSCA